MIKKKMFRTARGKKIITADFSSETMQAKDSRATFFKVLKGKPINLEFYYYYYYYYLDGASLFSPRLEYSGAI